MKTAGLRSKVVRKFRRTTDSNHVFPVVPNLVQQKFDVAAPNTVWVSDITYIPTQEGWLYLASTLDLYSRAVVGWSMGPTLQTSLVLEALQMAISHRRFRKGLIHHSDRASRYASGDFRKELDRHGIVCSMSGKGNCSLMPFGNSTSKVLERIVAEDGRTSTKPGLHLADHLETKPSCLRNL